jgi:hypothetical protein
VGLTLLLLLDERGLLPDWLHRLGEPSVRASRGCLVVNPPEICCEYVPKLTGRSYLHQALVQRTAEVRAVTRDLHFAWLEA